MTPHKHYARAPIQEALIDLKCSFGSEVGLPTLAEIHEQIAADYPTREDRVEITAEIGAESNASTKTTRTTMGYLFRGSQPHVFQARTDGFTMSRLHPYEDWDHLLAEAKRLWAVYVSAARPESVVRVGIRYINVIELPEGRIKLSEYFRTRPEVGPRQDISGFFMQVQIPQPRIKASAVVTQTVTPAKEAGGSIGFVLDIDVFKQVDLRPDSTRVWQEVGRLHDREYEIFRGCIKPKTEEVIS
jgi:uncharacterized protein (TIGR04255 family)